MRWFPFAILAYVFVAIQFSLGGIVGSSELMPNLVLLLLIFIGLHAPTDPAIVAGFILGFAHDIIAGSSLGIGTYTLAYPILAALAVQLRGTMYADHAVTHIAMTLLLGVMLSVYLWVRQWTRSWYFTEEPAVTLKGRLLGVLITAAFAIPVIWMLRKIRRSFAFESS